MRDRVGMVDLTPFVVFDVSGPGALDYLQTMTVQQLQRAVGRSVYTPPLDYHGGFRSDLTIMRPGRRRSSASSPAPSTRPATSSGSPSTSVDGIGVTVRRPHVRWPPSACGAARA